nr:hypothetical protein [Pseudobdellovibrionaceae bacterium]
PINNGNREIWGHVGRMSMIDNLTGRSATSFSTDISISKTPGDFSIPINGIFFWSLVPFEKVDFTLLGYNPSSALSAKKQTVFLIPGERYYFNVRLKKGEQGLEIVWTGQLFL